MTVSYPVRIIAPMLLVVAALSGCAEGTDRSRVASAGGTVAPSGSAAAPADDAELGRKFARCMRAEGIEMPDPGADGMVGVPAMAAGDEAAAKKMDAALRKCREFMPAGGEPPKMSAEDIAKAREFARCARENGVPDFPDPDPQTGRFKLEPGAAGDLDGLSELGDKCRQFGAGIMPGIEAAG